MPVGEVSTKPTQGTKIVYLIGVEGKAPDHNPRSFTSLSMVDYTLVKEQLGTVVVDHHNNEYVVYDFKIGCAAYQLWDKKEEAFYYTDYNAFNTFYQQISG